MPRNQRHPARMIGAALIGYGWWGKHLAPRLAQSPAFRLTGIAAPELSGEISIDGHPVLPNFDAALADPEIEAVILTSPNQMHESQTIAAAEAGKHVFCEKPMALSGAAARRMADAMTRAGRVLGIGHERRFEPAMQELGALVRTGQLGTIMHAELAFSHDKLIHVPPGNWRTMKETAPAAAMTGMGIHLTDALIGLFGRVSVVQALTGSRVLNWETGDTITVQLGFEAGMTATLSALLATPHFIRCHVFGATQWAEIRNDTHPDTPGGFAHLSLGRGEGAVETRRFAWEDTVCANLDAFAAAITGHAPYPIPLDEMVHNIEVLEAIIQAAETRQSVFL